jgi:Holliday junction resolvasome RuvABC endonuclease subunit
VSVPLIVGIDPGLRQCGVAAVFPSGELRFAFLVKNPERDDDGAQAVRSMARAVLSSIEERLPDFRGVDVLAVERQQIRMARGKLLTKNPSQIITLAQVAGAIIALVPAEEAHAVWPSSWNKSQKKSVVEEEILTSLSDDELLRFEPCADSARNNVADGIGLARWAAKKITGLDGIETDWREA